jgi:hypothetical protein
MAMASLRKFLWSSFGAITLPMPAAAAQPAPVAADVCGAIDRIAASASVRPAFLPIRRALAEGQAVVPGFEAGECAVTPDGVECRGRSHRSDFTNWPELDICRDVVAFEPPLPYPQVQWPSNRSYRLGRFLISRGFRCPGCRALGPSYFTMTFYRPRDRHQ